MPTNGRNARSQASALIHGATWHHELYVAMPAGRNAQTNAATGSAVPDQSGRSTASTSSSLRMLLLGVDMNSQISHSWQPTTVCARAATGKSW